MIVDLLTPGPLAQVVPDVVTDVVDTSDVSTWDPMWSGVTLVVGALLAVIGRRATRRSCEAVNLPHHMVDLSVTLVTWSIITLAVLIALSFVGLAPNWIWLMGVLLIIAFIIGGRVMMESFGAGITLQARAPFTRGDLVRLGEDLEGVVVEINSRVVVLDTIDGQRLFVPNQLALKNPIANLTRKGRRMSRLSLDVAYGTDLDLASRLAEEALVGVGAVLETPRPVAEVASFEASAVRIRLRFWHAPDRLGEWAAVDAAAQAAYTAYQANDIEFAFPQQTLWWGESQRPEPGA